MGTYKEMLQKIMEKKGYNQEQLANALKVNKAQITRWLGGAIPKFGNLHKIINLYNEANK